VFRGIFKDSDPSEMSGMAIINVENMDSER
jgi:hypothetical protein